MALVELAVFYSPLGAAMARGRLAAEGIEAVLFDDGLSSLGLGLMAPARLMVEEADLEAAEAVLAEDHR
jgi:hypothetical protein